MIKKELSGESNGKLPHLFIPSKTATLVPEFAVEDLPLDRTATLVPAFAVQDLTLGNAIAESNGKIPHLFIPSNNATLVSEFAVEDLPLGRTAALEPEFAMKDLLAAAIYTGCSKIPLTNF